MYGKQDREAAHHITHTLKGVAGNLGAKAVAEAATELDALLRGTTNPPDEVILLARIGETAKALGQLVRMLGKPASVPEVTATPADLARSPVVLAELARLLVKSDARARSHFEENAPCLRAVLGSQYLPLAELVERFEFEEALEMLNRLQHQMPGND